MRFRQRQRRDMNPFWSLVCDRVKDRRYGSLFFFTFAGLIGLWALVGWLSKTSWRDSLVYAIPLGFGFFLIWLITTFYRAFRQHKPAKYPQLSSDEVAKARSKLLKNRDRRNV